MSSRRRGEAARRGRRRRRDRVGGPGPDGDESAGSVYAAVTVRGEIRDAHLQFDGEPSEVVHQTARAALEMLREALSTV